MALLAAYMSMRAISSPNAIRVIRVHSECTQSAIRVQSARLHEHASAEDAQPIQLGADMDPLIPGA